MVSKAAELRFLRHLGTLVLAMNIMVAAFSLSDMYLLASGAVQVRLPTEKDFTWRFDTDQNAIIFTGNYTVRNSGFYDISDLNIDASVKDSGGLLLVAYRKGNMNIPAFGGGNYTVVAKLPLERLFQLNFGSMLFQPANFKVHVKISAQYVMGMARFVSEETIGYNWSPPLKDFAKLFLEDNFTSVLKSSVPGLADLAGYVESYVASAIMAKGVPVVLKVADMDLVFRYDEDKLFVSLWPHASSGSSILNLEFDVPQGGEDVGGA